MIRIFGFGKNNKDDFNKSLEIYNRASEIFSKSDRAADGVMRLSAAEQSKKLKLAFDTKQAFSGVMNMMTNHYNNNIKIDYSQYRDQQLQGHPKLALDDLKQYKDNAAKLATKYFQELEKFDKQGYFSKDVLSNPEHPNYKKALTAINELTGKITAVDGMLNMAYQMETGKNLEKPWEKTTLNITHNTNKQNDVGPRIDSSKLRKTYDKDGNVIDKYSGPITSGHTNFKDRSDKTRFTSLVEDALRFDENHFASKENVQTANQPPQKGERSP